MGAFKSKIIEAVLADSSEENPAPIQVQEEYTRLNEKCDVVISKIKNRKQKKSK
jgi:hypothetical protein